MDWEFLLRATKPRSIVEQLARRNSMHSERILRGMHLPRVLGLGQQPLGPVLVREPGQVLVVAVEPLAVQRSRRPTPPNNLAVHLAVDPVVAAVAAAVGDILLAADILLVAGNYSAAESRLVPAHQQHPPSRFHWIVP